MTLTKSFNFISDTEGWNFTNASGGSGGIKSRWKHPRATTKSYSGLGWNFVADGGGSLSSSVNNDNTASQNYWELSTTWETLGVPKGCVVTSIQATYAYRWFAGGSRQGPASWSNKKSSAIVLSAGDSKTGPFQLRDSGGTLLGTFSNAIDCPARTGFGDWVKYPAGTNQFPIQEIPDAFTNVSSASVSVPIAQQKSSSTIKLRLNNTLPAAPANDTGSDLYYYFALRNDTIILTITYNNTTEFFHLLARR